MVKTLKISEEKAMDHALDTLESVYQEVYMAETESIEIACQVIRRNAEKYNSVELKKLADIISLWGKEPMSDILSKLKGEKVS
nr:hypothetical protein 21 [bacterium]